MYHRMELLRVFAVFYLQQPFAMGPSTGVQAQAPPPQAPAAMYQMLPQQQMAQGQNIRAQMQPPPQPAAATMQAGYQIRPSYHMTQQGGVATAVAPPSQQWGNIMEQQVTQPVMQQPEMGQQELQNGMTGMCERVGVTCVSASANGRRGC